MLTKTKTLALLNYYHVQICNLSCILNGKLPRKNKAVYLSISIDLVSRPDKATLQWSAYLLIHKNGQIPKDLCWYCKRKWVKPNELPIFLVLSSLVSCWQCLKWSSLIRWRVSMQVLMCSSFISAWVDHDNYADQKNPGISRRDCGPQVCLTAFRIIISTLFNLSPSKWPTQITGVC